MPSQNLLIEDYKEMRLQFVICESCYWCATCLTYKPDSCPACGSDVNSMPLRAEGAAVVGCTA